MGVALELVGGLIAEELHAVSALDERLPFGGEALQFDRADFGAVLLLLAPPLRLLIVIQFALDTADGAVPAAIEAMCRQALASSPKGSIPSFIQALRRWKGTFVG